MASVGIEACVEVCRCAAQEPMRAVSPVGEERSFLRLFHESDWEEMAVKLGAEPTLAEVFFASAGRMVPIARLRKVAVEFRGGYLRIVCAAGVVSFADLVVAAGKASSIDEYFPVPGLGSISMGTRFFSPGAEINRLSRRIAGRRQPVLAGILEPAVRDDDVVASGDAAVLGSAASDGYEYLYYVRDEFVARVAVLCGKNPTVTAVAALPREWLRAEGKVVVEGGKLAAVAVGSPSSADGGTEQLLCNVLDEALVKLETGGRPFRVSDTRLVTRRPRVAVELADSVYDGEATVAVEEVLHRARCGAALHVLDVQAVVAAAARAGKRFDYMPWLDRGTKTSCYDRYGYKRPSVRELAGYEFAFAFNAVYREEFRLKFQDAVAAAAGVRRSDCQFVADPIALPPVIPETDNSWYAQVVRGELVPSFDCRGVCETGDCLMCGVVDGRVDAVVVGDHGHLTIEAVRDRLDEWLMEPGLYLGAEDDFHRLYGSATGLLADAAKYVGRDQGFYAI